MIISLWAGIVQLIYKLAMGWAVLGINPSGLTFSTSVQTAARVHPFSRE
jgi:hypothetical protein